MNNAIDKYFQFKIDDESQLDYHNFANFLYRQGDWFGGIEQEQIMIAASKCYVGYEDR